MKEQLIKHLKTKSINDTNELWLEANKYLLDRDIVNGGSYNTGETFILLRVNNKHFKIQLEEIL